MANIANFNNTFKQLDKIFVERIDKVEEAMRKSMADMVSTAKSNAPTGKTGKLKQSISWRENSKLSYDLIADTPYAAYVEFGTGKDNYKARDEYWDSIANDFYVDGSGRTPAHPFFYPAVNKELPKLIERIKKILSKNA